jgi:hypothetical protein
VRKALQAPHHGRGERVHDQDREHEHVELEEGGEQDAGHRGQARAQGPAHHADAPRASAVERGQVAIVDLGPHGDTDTRAIEDEAQHERDDEGDRHRDHLVPRDERVDDAEAAVAPEELGQSAAFGLPDRVGEAHQAEHEAHGDDERCRKRRVV